MLLSSNFAWLKDLKVEQRNNHILNNIIKDIATIEQMIETEQYDIGNKTRQILEYALWILFESDKNTLSDNVHKVIKKHNPTAEVHTSIVHLQQFGNESSHASSNMSPVNPTESVALALLRNVSVTLIYVLCKRSFLTNPQAIEKEFQFSTYSTLDSTKIVQKAYKSDLAASTINVDNKGLFEYVIDSNHNFYIPHYQREYSWNKMHIVTLFDDIAKRVNDRKPHHLGVIALTKDKGRIRIIDGQQRITTMLIILKAFKDYFQEHNIHVPDFDTWDTDIKIKYANVSSDVFDSIKYILETTEIRKPSKHTSSIAVENYNTIKDRIIFFNARGISAKEQFITLKENFLITPFMHKDLDLISEIEVFENLNSKGKILTQTDMIVNWQISSIKPALLHKEKEIREILDRNIKEIFDKHKLKKPPATYTLDKFYEAYNTYHTSFSRGNTSQLGEDPSNKIYNKFKTIWKYSNCTLESFNTQLQDVSKHLKIWILLTNKLYLENKIFTNTQDYLTTLSNKNVHYALVTFLLNKLGLFNTNNDLIKIKYKKEFTICLHILEIYLVRLVGSRTGQSLAPIFNVAIKELDTATPRDFPAKLWQYFKGAPSNPMPSIGTWKADLKNKISPWAQASMLIAIEKYLINFENEHVIDHLPIPREFINIEHIIPKKPKVPPFKNYEEVIELIGNKTLLSSTTNKSLTNKSFKEKKSGYPKRGILQLNGFDAKFFKIKGITEYNTFEAKEIKSRSKELIDAAIKGPFKDYKY